MVTHPNYPHPGPGPSSYYQQSPPPHHVYGNNSPGPRPNYYPYNLPPPPPPHMNSHQPTQYHQPPPSRGNHRGNGQYGSRGNHHYHHHYQHQPPYPHSHVTPNVGVHAPHIPYSPQTSKYNQPYSPSYTYPSPTAPVFTPSWQQQPLSPLPKQLSMPPPQNVQSNIYDSATTQAPSAESSAEAQSAEPVPMPSSSATTFADGASPSLSSPESLDLVAQPSQPSSYSQMGTISTSSEPVSSPSTTQQPTVVSSPGKWAIWSRRPRDPSQAPSIIISPRSFPPPDVIQQALDEKTPPPSIPSSPTITKKQPLSSFREQEGTPPARDIPLSPPSQSSDDIAGAAWSSQTASSVPSSSVTETTDTPTIPGSPASSHTSLSIKDSKDTSVTQEVSAPADAAAVAESTSTSTISAALEHEPAEPFTDTKLAEPSAEAVDGAIPVPIPAPAVVVTAVAAAVAAPQPIAAQELPAATATSASPQPTPAATPAIKKSWASLLRPSSSAAVSPSGPSRNALPTSSVVGFSIPASTSPPVPAVSPTKKSELITLLTTGPAPATAASVAAGASSASSVMKIRPRGLINSGNMCFANSVLQILVYCPPFHKLFVELGKVLGPSATGPTSGTSTPPLNGREEKPKVASATPLVDATVEFLKEFVDEKKSKPKDKARLEIVGRSGSSGGLSGKGKEREVRVEEDDDDDWDGESFLPTYVYDAMKEKKRFDNMRGGHQEDAEEFFGFYLDTLEEELLSLLHSVNPPRQSKGTAVEEKEEAAPPEDEGWLEVGKRNRTVITRTIKATESPITRIFGGKFRSTLRAPGQKDSVVVEDWRSLRLDIQREQIHTIQEALSYISHPQPVQVTPKAGLTIDAQQQMLIEALPPILVLHIKRFCYDTSVGGVVKVGKHVSFGPELEIGSDVMVPAAKKAHPTRYKLFGALYHHGLSAGGGHYTLDVLHPNRYPSANPAAKPREGWVRIDDNLVSDVRHEDVFGQNEKDESRSPYLLFYRRA